MPAAPAREQVVVECLRDDHGIDQPDDVVERAQVGGVDHGLDAATLADNIGAGLVVLAVQIGAGERQAWCVTLVECTRFLLMH